MTRLRQWSRRFAPCAVVTAIMFLLPGLVSAQNPPYWPTPTEYQMGVGGGGQFKSLAGRNNVIFMGSDVAGVFRSLDNGQHWHIANRISATGTTQESGITDPSVLDILWTTAGATDRVVVATADGIFYSDNPAIALPGLPTWTRATLRLPNGGDPFLPDLDGGEGFPPLDPEHPGKNLCRVNLGPLNVRGSVSALTSYYDSQAQVVHLLAVSGFDWQDAVGYRDTHRDLIYESTNDGQTWTVYRIYTPATNPSDPCWGRAFSDIEVFDNKIWVALISGDGVLSHALTNLDDGQWDNVRSTPGGADYGLVPGCGFGLLPNGDPPPGPPSGYSGPVYGIHPIEFTKFDSNDDGTDELFVAMQTVVTPISGTTCPSNLGLADYGVYKRVAQATGWTNANGSGATSLPSPPGFSSPYYAYNRVRKFTYDTGTPNRSAIFTTRTNINWPAIETTDSFSYYSTNGADWHPLSRAYLNQAGAGQECGSTVWKQLGNDMGPFEFGKDGFVCIGAPSTPGLLEWYPNYDHQLRVTETRTGGVSADADLFDVSSGAFLFDHAKVATTINAQSTYSPSTVDRITSALNWIDVTGQGTCRVSALTDWNDNQERCWQNAAVYSSVPPVPALPDISAITDAATFRGKLWVGRVDAPAAQWRFDLNNRNWEEFFLPLPRFSETRLPCDSLHPREYDSNLGSEIVAIATREGWSANKTEDPATVDCDTQRTDIRFPAVILAGGNWGGAAYASGFIIKMEKCVDSAHPNEEWPLKRIQLVGEQNFGPACGPGEPTVRSCPTYGQTEAGDDIWQPCNGMVTDLVWSPPVSGQTQSDGGTFFAAVTGRRMETDPDLDRGEIGIYKSADGVTWTMIAKDGDAGVGYPKWRDPTQFCPLGNNRGCLWDSYSPFKFSVVVTDLYLSLHGDMTWCKNLACQGSGDYTDAFAQSGIWKWNRTTNKFVRINFSRPLFNIAGVSKNKNNKLIAIAGRHYHPSIEGVTGAPDCYDDDNQRAGIYRCDNPASCDWKCVWPELDYTGFPSGEDPRRPVDSVDLVTSACIGTESGGNCHGYYFGAFRGAAIHSVESYGLIVSNDGINWKEEDVPAGHRTFLRLDVLNLNKNAPNEKMLGIGSQAGLYVLDFP